MIPQRLPLWILRIGIAAILAVEVIVFLASGARAAEPPRHPLGNFTTNTYDGLVVAPDGVRVEHVEDLAEIPTAQVKPQLDAQGPAIWARARCQAAADSARLTLDGRVFPLTVGHTEAVTRPGQAGLATLRVTCDWQAQARNAGTIGFQAPSPSAGWHEITAQADRMTLTAADVPARSRSLRLTAYPADLLSSPLNQRSAHLRARPGGPALTEPTAAAPGILPRGTDTLTRKFTSLVSDHPFTPVFAVVSLLIALALGSLHALAPGHGKTLMAAYAVTRSHRAGRDILALGLTVTVTHTAGVLVLGVLAASTAYAPVTLYPWLTFLSGLLIATAGFTLFRRARVAPGHSEKHHHGHGGAHVHTAGSGALLERVHTHVHEPVRERGTRSAVLMGFAGGLVPSPSAVVVLLGATALGRAWFGVLLVLAYGAGLAASLLALGMIISGPGRGLTARLHAGTHGRAGRLADVLHKIMHSRGTLPGATAGIVVVMGAWIALRGLGGVL
jgi:ABC-type nickel/cobalt efflux system permease component RcnA